MNLWASDENEEENTMAIENNYIGEVGCVFSVKKKVCRMEMDFYY